MLNPSYPRKQFTIGAASAGAVCGISMDTGSMGAENRIWRDTGINIGISACDMFAIFDTAGWAAVRSAVQVGETAVFGDDPYTIVSVGGVFDPDGKLVLVGVTGSRASGS